MSMQYRPYSKDWHQLKQRIESSQSSSNAGGPSCHVYWMIEVDGERKWNEVEVSRQLKISVLGYSEPGKSEWRFQMECEKTCGRDSQRGSMYCFSNVKWEYGGRGAEAMTPMSLY